MDVSDEKLSYISGFFDGEGCITVGGSYLSLTVSASNTDIRPLEMIRNALGGKVHVRGKQKWIHRDIYGWSIYGKDAAAALTALLPYLIVKRKRALLGIKLASAKVDDRVDVAVGIRVLNTTGEA